MFVCEWVIFRNGENNRGCPKAKESALLWDIYDFQQTDMKKPVILNSHHILHSLEKK